MILRTKVSAIIMVYNKSSSIEDTLSIKDKAAEPKVSVIGAVYTKMSVFVPEKKLACVCVCVCGREGVPQRYLSKHPVHSVHKQG